LDSSYLNGNCAGLDIKFGSGLDLFISCITIDLYFIFPNSAKMAKFKCYYCPTASSNLQDIVDQYVKDHKAFKIKVKEKNLEENGDFKIKIF
jgi:hypothetical protein